MSKTVMYFQDLENFHIVLKISTINNIPISGLSYDSRTLSENDLFFAVKGDTQDGNIYLPDAVKKQAAGAITDDITVFEKYCVNINIALVENTEKAMAIIGDRFYGNILDKFQLIGITGTNGKTSTAIFTSLIIKNWNKGCGLFGTLYNDTGTSVKASSMTTPLSLETIKGFYDLYNNGIYRAVMEVSSHAIVRNRVYGFPFYIGAITNISQDHLDYHLNMEKYRAVKFSFLENVMKEGCCIINYELMEDPMIKAISKGKNIRTFNHSNADYFIMKKKYLTNMVLLWVRTDDSIITLSTPFYNEFMHENILLSIAIAKTLGITNAFIVDALENAPLIPGRVELVYNGAFSVYVDYAHTPEAIMRVLKDFRGLFQNRRIITLFGAGGNKDRGKRPLMGKYAAIYSNIIILTSDNPRDEDPLGIIQEIYSGIDSERKRDIVIYIEKDRERAIGYAVEMAREGDIILILGKGHETTMEVSGKYYTFDDKEIIKKNLK